MTYYIDLFSILGLDEMTGIFLITESYQNITE